MMWADYLQSKSLPPPFLSPTQILALEQDSTSLRRNVPRTTAPALQRGTFAYS